MKKKLSPEKQAIITYVSETILWIGYLIMTVLSISSFQETVGPQMRIFAALSLLIYALIFAHHGIQNRGKNLQLSFDFGSTFVFLCLGIAGLIDQEGAWCFPVLGVGFFFAFILRRIPRLIANHSKRNIVFSVLVIIFNGVLVLVSIANPVPYIVLFLIDFAGMALAVFNIMVISFSRIRFGLLMKILRKTYVGEIMFGLLTLIATFSLVLMAWEDCFQNYGDALWYCFAIVTTIGFGDFAAVSILGRILSVILGMYGIVVVAVITSVIVNFYQESSKEDEQSLTLMKNLDQLSAEMQKEEENQ